MRVAIGTSCDETTKAMFCSKVVDLKTSSPGPHRITGRAERSLVICRRRGYRKQHLGQRKELDQLLLTRPPNERIDCGSESSVMSNERGPKLKSTSAYHRPGTYL